MRDFVWETLISDNVTALMEARGDSKANDYTADIEEEDNEVSDEEEGQPVEAEADDYTTDVDSNTETDATDYTDDPDDEPETTDDVEDGEPDEATDYTADTDGDPENTDSGDEGNEEATDYGEDSPTGGEDDGDVDSADTDSGDGGVDDSPGDSVTNEEELDSKMKNIDLHDSFVYMYNRVSDFQTKLDIIQNSSYIITRIITQVNKNLVNLKTAISDYLFYSFENNSYVRNLYNYNHFLESLRLNMIIMGKIKDLIPDAQNN